MKIPKNFPEWLLYHKRFLIYFVIQLLFIVIVINYKPKVQAAENVIPTIMRLDTTVNRIFAILTTLAKNDSVMSVQLKHFPTAPPISVQEMTAVSSIYRSRTNPITHEKEFHAGIDYRAKKGTIVVAAADGIVFKARKEGNYGNLIAINHLNGYETTYAHLDQILVREDQQVTKGDTIGTVGNTGRSTGDHLHFEIAYLDRKINPEQFYPF
jgi:murein DD-endopeptidase MepM/ murein hydrolase activator NlpD